MKWDEEQNRTKRNEEEKKLPEKEMDSENMWMCDKDIMDIRRRYRTHALDIISVDFSFFFFYLFFSIVGLSLGSSALDYMIKLPI